MLLKEIEGSETRIGEIDGRFTEPNFYQSVAPDEIRSLEEERTRLQSHLEGLVEEWGQVEEDLASFGS